MKKILLGVILIASIGCLAQKKETAVTKDEEGNLIGITNKADFLQEPYTDWFSPNYNDYKTNKEIINKLKPLLKDITIKAFMGTWCSDSQEQTPAFYKILDETGFSYKNLELVAVNRDRETPDNLQKGFDIERVPTLIFYKEGKEIGRFVEYPRETIEVDILKIVSGKPYKHSYED
ncbi:thioredoxin family protein [Lutibacter sp.]